MNSFYGIFLDFVIEGGANVFDVLVLLNIKSHERVLYFHHHLPTQNSHPLTIISLYKITIDSKSPVLNMIKQTNYDQILIGDPWAVEAYLDFGGEKLLFQNLISYGNRVAEKLEDMGINITSS